MSGSSKSSYRPNDSLGRGDTKSSDPCDLHINATLYSPNPDIVYSLKVDDRLFVVLDQNQTIVAMTDQNEPAGTITAISHIDDLLDCLRNGTEYEALVINISGSQVEVLITRVTT